jgi:hypothetical protein
MLPDYAWAPANGTDTMTPTVTESAVTMSWAESRSIFSVNPRRSVGDHLQQVNLLSPIPTDLYRNRGKMMYRQSYVMTDVAFSVDPS